MMPMRTAVAPAQGKRFRNCANAACACLRMRICVCLILKMRRWRFMCYCRKIAKRRNCFGRSCRVLCCWKRRRGDLCRAMEGFGWCIRMMMNGGWWGVKWRLGDWGSLKMGMERRRLVAKLLQTEHDWFAKMRDVGEPPTLHWVRFQAAFWGHLCGSLKPISTHFCKPKPHCTIQTA